MAKQRKKPAAQDQINLCKVPTAFKMAVLKAASDRTIKKKKRVTVKSVVMNTIIAYDLEIRDLYKQYQAENMEDD